VKQLLRFLGVVAVVAMCLAALNLSQSTAQNAADPFVTQFTNFCADAYAGGISGNGRFVVVESNGDIATERTAARNNADGSREIFLVDYAQRRVFQITNGKNSVRPTPTPSPTATATPTATPTPTPTPTPDPSATPTPTPIPPFPTPTPTPACAPPPFDTTVGVAVTNLRPVISHDGRWIVFSSNAPTPANFDATVDANRMALLADGNQELWLYNVPQVANPNADLASGDEQPLNDLSTGTFTRITNTTPSRPLRENFDPADIIDDNREPAVNDDASVVAFVSVRNLTGNNADLNAEIFAYRRVNPAITQITNTPFGNITNPLFNSNPSVSGQTLPGTARLAWISNANVSIGGTGNNSDLNAEVYFGTFDGALGTVAAQLTRTTAANPGVSVNLFPPGKHLSRDGNFLAFESSSNAPGSNGAAQATAGLYLVNVTNPASPVFTEIGPRATSGADVSRFPTFSGDNSTLVWASVLDFNPDGTQPSPSPSASPTTTTGLNPRRVVQLFTAPVAQPSPLAARKLTETPDGGFAIQHFVSNTTQRIAFSSQGANFGTGSFPSAAQVYYFAPRFAPSPAASPSPVVTLFTGAANRPLGDPLASPSPTASPTATPTPSPTPTPTGSPSPTPVPPVTTATPVAGLAPGMIGRLRANVPLAPSPRQSNPAGNQSPFFPVELNGVSVAIGGASSGLLFVGPTEIQFLVPENLGSATTGILYPIVVNNNGARLESIVRLNSAQPDLFGDPARPGRAAALNITNTMMGAGTVEPFNVTTVDGLGRTVPTVIALSVTGLRGVSPNLLTVRVGTTDISGSDNVLAVVDTGFPGIQEVWFRLPASLAGAGDVPVIVYLTGTQNSTTPEDGNPLRILIN
jgi:uncharacterized protein (TIGR03437 family)